jgi:predicted ATPase/DNA-binding winged helix-turn-helix (wHTH) protein
MSEPHPLIFPPFHLDVTHGRLCRGADCVPMRLKTLAVLRYLIEHRDRVVSRDELSQAIWPGRFGADAAPKQCILELRRLLGESPHQPRFIQTCGRHGYRFIGPLAAESSSPATPIGGGLADPARRDYCAGRDAVLARLHAAWEQAQAGHSHCVLLLGPAGIGKTTVATTFLQRINVGRRGWAARGQCIEHHGEGEAYLALLDALGSLARGRWRTRLSAVLNRHAPLWLLQLPALIPPGGEAALRQRVQGIDSARMLRELTEAFEALTRHEPGVLLLEDAQWANPSTLEWLNAWILRQGAARLLVIVTWRTDDGGVKRVDEPLASGLFNEWRRRPGVTLIPLTELEPAAVEAYLQARFADAGLAARLAPVLHQRSGGQPFLMNALVEQWLARQLLASVDGAWHLTADLDILASSVPITARELIEKRLATLSFDEHQTLGAASVLGAEFTTALLAAVLDCDRDAQERRCAALARRDGLLREAGLSLEPDETISTRYAFRHVLYQDVIYDHLSAGQRCFLHRRAGHALEVAHAGDTLAVAAALAQHFEQGRDPDRASRYYQQASQTALSRHAPREAALCLDKALALLQHLPESAERKQRELELRLALDHPLTATGR